MRLLGCLIILLVLSLFLFAPASARAEPRFVPALVYEAFHREHPEESSVVRLGGAFRFLFGLPFVGLSAEAEGLYANETTPFANDNSLREVMYRARGGLSYRVASFSPLALNVRGGFQYAIINDAYAVKVTGLKEVTSAKYGSLYGGFDVELIPVTGFGIIAGATLSEHRPLNKWIAQCYMGIVLK